MPVIDFTVDEDVIVVEFQRELLEEKPTRLLEIVPGDKIAVRDLYGAMEVTINKIRDWGKPEDGCTWFVYYRDGGAEKICNAQELVDKWAGVWLS